MQKDFTRPFRLAAATLILAALVAELPHHPADRAEDPLWCAAGVAEPYRGLSILSTNQRANTKPRTRPQVSKTITYKRRKGTVRTGGGVQRLGVRRRR